MRSDVAIARNRAPEEGHSRRLRSREAPIRGNGGTILPTTRPADLSQHDRRHRPATSPLGQGAPSDGQPASSRPPPGRGVRPVRGRGLRLRVPSRAPDLRRRPSVPKRTGGRSYEKGLASRLDHRRRRAEARQPSNRRRTDRPGKGRHRPQTRHTRRISLRGRAASGRGPTLPRTVRSVTRIRHQDNRLPSPGSQIPVHGFPIRAQFIDRLSPELPTGRRPR